MLFSVTATSEAAQFKLLVENYIRLPQFHLIEVHIPPNNNYAFSRPNFRASRQICTLKVAQIHDWWDRQRSWHGAHR